jgi:urate oxidase
MTHISYGKLQVPVQLVGPTGLLACEVSMEVLGQGFLPAYTEGDNSAVVATDTMKNVILRRALDYRGTTLEGFLDELGRSFLQTYPEMEGLRLWADEQPFVAISEKLYRRTDADRTTALLELGRAADGTVALTAQRSGQVGLRLLKTTGSAFTRFARDGDTTLPERSDRPLYIALDVHWAYRDPHDAVGPAHVPPAAVLDEVLATFDAFVSESIQHLVHEMGARILSRFDALAQVSFRGENHTFDPIAAADGTVFAPTAEHRAYTSAFPAWGLITLVMDR